MEQKLETNNDVLICNLCNKQYKNRSGLWKHHNTIHTTPNSSKPSKSSSISTNSSSKSSVPSNNFNTNTNTNNNQSELFCINCNKLFSRSDNLKRHILICKNVKKSNNTTKLTVDLAAENKLLKEHLKKQDEMMKKLIYFFQIAHRVESCTLPEHVDPLIIN